MLCVTAVFVPVYFISLFFQFIRGDGALKAAGRLAPFLVALVVIGLVQGGVMGKEGHYAPWYIGASAVTIAGATLLFTVNENTPNSRIYGYTFLLGLGSGCVVQTGFIAAQAIVPRSEMAMSVAFLNLAQVTGIVLWLSLSNTIFLNLAQKYVADVLPNADPTSIKAAISGTGSAFLNTLTPELRQQVLSGVVRAIQRTYCLVMATASLEFILSFGLKWERVFLQM